MSQESLFQSGINCWRVERARRAAFLVDGAAYFHAVRAAMEQAQRSILILGWDIDSRLHLDPIDCNPHCPDGLPERLGDFLNTLAERHPKLHIHILTWDFSMIYLMEREWLPVYKLGWQSHRRVHFRMDGRHPPGASHHQKIVVVDDKVAFVGGLDLTKWRWDTNHHLPNDERRLAPEGVYYPPFHDAQMIVDGPAAAALATLCRERWQRATGRGIGTSSLPADGDPWPSDLYPELREVEVAISRTEPLYAGRREVREVERLFHEMIASARRTIYVENQYFTSNSICTALSRRLAEPDGPEVVLILPLRSSGWLEQHTMDVLRARTLRRLREADRHGRLAVYYPALPQALPHFINVHDKVMIIDDRVARVGSANLSNRSMGLDTECDLTVESGNETASATIAALRQRLLAEHLAVTAAEVRAAEGREGSLIEAVESLRGRGRRTLEPLDGQVDPAVEAALPESELVDPERPIDPDLLVQRILSEEERQPASRHLLRNVTLIGLVVALAVAWRWTPLGALLDPTTLLALFTELRDLPAAPLLLLAAYVVGGVVALPLMVLVVVTILAYGAGVGFLYSLIGALLSAVASFGLGHYLGRDMVRRVAGARLNALSQRLARRGVVAMAVVRVLPIAPYAVVNLVAGASHISFRDFLLGTVIGITPGLFVTALLVDRMRATLRAPDPANFLLLLLVATLLAALAYALRRLIKRRRAAAAGAGEETITSGNARHPGHL